MKSLKTAAALAGFVVVAGTAAPAFAQSAADVTPTSLNGAVNRLTQGPLDVMPLHHQSGALDTEKRNSVLHTAKGVAGALNQHTRLLGGLPLQT
ncbi:hypothetical protein [Streptomyces sp. NPDC001307]|uniref:hypothetical protein n=1 Tax=Streptomyces sp. NPDC001307 TaxID=3364560 RepID=UPI003695376C